MTVHSEIMSRREIAGEMNATAQATAADIDQIRLWLQTTADQEIELELAELLPKAADYFTVTTSGNCRSDGSVILVGAFSCQIGSPGTLQLRTLAIFPHVQHAYIFRN